MAINAERDAIKQFPWVTNLSPDDAIVSYEPGRSILNKKNLPVSWTKNWSNNTSNTPTPEVHLADVRPTPMFDTPTPTPQPTKKHTPTPIPSETLPARNTPTPTESPQPTNTATPPRECTVTDLKGAIYSDGNHWDPEKDRVMRGYMENISQNPECPNQVLFWLYGSELYPEDPNWIESQRFLLVLGKLSVPAGARVEFEIKIPETDSRYCQVDAVRGQVPPIEPPVPPRIAGDKMIDYIFYPCGRPSGPQPTEVPPQPTLTETPPPLLPTGNPPEDTEGNPNWELVGYALLIAGGASYAGYLWKRKHQETS